MTQTDNNTCDVDVWNSLSLEDRLKFFELAWLKKHPRYRYKPVSFTEFVKSPMFLDEGNSVYQKWLEVGEEIASSKYNELVIMAGIGSGKSYFVSLLVCYLAHLLLCLKNPHKHFNLSEDKPITIINMGLKEAQARKVVFSSISNLIYQSSWFRRFDVEILKKSILLDGKIELMCGNSQETTPLGYNIFASILDEAAFYLDKEDKSKADDIFSALRSRTASRFGNNGLTIAISSPRDETDFINQKINESKENPEKILGIKMPTWEAKDREKMSKEVFIFEPATGRILSKEEQSRYEIDEGSLIDLSVRGAHKKLLRFAEKVLNEKLWIIPMDYHDSFKKNPERAARDLGTLVQKPVETFIKIQEHIDNAIGKCTNRVDNTGVWDVKNPPHEPVFIHIDLGLNKNGGDAAGIAVCRCVGNDESMSPIIRFDFVERITAGINGEITFSDIRTRVIQLYEEGWNIFKVTLDGWQSRDTIQILSTKGILCEYLSVDRTPEPYEALKEALYAQRVQLPKLDILTRELKELRMIKGKKVDHPTNGSKDVSDAVAGALFSCIQNGGFHSSNQLSSIRFR